MLPATFSGGENRFPMHRAGSYPQEGRNNNHSIPSSAELLHACGGAGRTLIEGVLFVTPAILMACSPQGNCLVPGVYSTYLLYAVFCCCIASKPARLVVCRNVLPFLTSRRHPYPRRTPATECSSPLPWWSGSCAPSSSRFVFTWLVYVYPSFRFGSVRLGSARFGSFLSSLRFSQVAPGTS